MNQLEWAENTLQEAEEQLVSTSTSQTPVPQEKTRKRLREEESPSATDTTSKEFKIMYKKRTKLNLKANTDKGLEHEAVVVTKYTPSSSQVGG